MASASPQALSSEGGNAPVETPPHMSDRPVSAQCFEAEEQTAPRCDVAVYGAGIAGLSVAHELALRGHSVCVYEATDKAGGFFRSGRHPGRGGMPTEYSWHGFGPWYHNAYDLLKQIPFDATHSLYDRALSRPIDFGIFPDDERAEFYDEGLRSIPRMFRFGPFELIRWGWVMVKVWTSRSRSHTRFASMNAAAAWRPFLKARGFRAWKACFGPWIGSDWTRVSLHHCGHFFRRQLISKPTHLHPGDTEGPAWTHGAGDGWLLLRGPSSEFWFERWVRFLETRGVRFVWNAPLHSLRCEAGKITSAACGDRVIYARHHVVAINPFAAADVFSRTPELEALAELRLHRPLTAEGEHVQVSLRIAFGEAIRFSRPRVAIVLSDTEFNFTLFAQEQAWLPGVGLGDGVKSLWTVTSCAGNVPGRIFGKPVTQCTREQFLMEARAQLTGSFALNQMMREANDGRSLADFAILAIEVWDEWTFTREGLRSLQPKWVNTSANQCFRPTQRTPLPNLFLAGAHTKTSADVWSIEGAVESGRRAAQGIDSNVHIIEQYDPRWLRTVWAVDDWLFSSGLPHVLVCGLWIAVLALVLLVSLGITAWAG